MTNEEKETLDKLEKEYQEEIKRLEQLETKYKKSANTLSKVRIFGWIILIIGFIVIPKSLVNIIMFVLLAIGNLTLPVSANENYNNVVNEIIRKRYQYEHSPEKEKEKKEKELQCKIEIATPFKSVEEKGDFYISSISWDLTDREDRILGVNVVLLSKTKYIKNLYFKYKENGKPIKPPVGMIDREFLEISRSKMYILRDEGKYEECAKLFREVFEKDPFTGEDLEVNKE